MKKNHKRGQGVIKIQIKEVRSEKVKERVEDRDDEKNKHKKN